MLISLAGIEGLPVFKLAEDWENEKGENEAEETGENLTESAATSERKKIESLKDCDQSGVDRKQHKRKMSKRRSCLTIWVQK
jgi:hypothetical protein